MECFRAGILRPRAAFSAFRCPRRSLGYACGIVPSGENVKEIDVVAIPRVVVRTVTVKRDDEIAVDIHGD